MSENSNLLLTSSSISGEEIPGEETVVALDPTRGGRITAYFTRFAEATLHWLIPARGDRPSCIPMVPFCSRINRGHFTFAGQQVQLPANNPPEPHAIHGHGFQRAWTVVDRGPRHAVIEYVHCSGAWPWSYSVRQSFVLDGRYLSVEMEVHNHSEDDMPLGLGLHPYFPKTAQTRVSATVGKLCRLDKALMPVAMETIPVQLDPSDTLIVGDLVLDHVFTDWQGEAVIEWPEYDAGLVLRVHGEARHLVLWAPPGEEFICVEPVSNLPDAFNLGASFDPAYAVLEGGATSVERWSFTPHLE